MFACDTQCSRLEKAHSVTLDMDDSLGCVCARLRMGRAASAIRNFLDSCIAEPLRIRTHISRIAGECARPALLTISISWKVPLKFLTLCSLSVKKLKFANGTVQWRIKFFHFALLFRCRAKGVLRVDVPQMVRV